MTAETLPTIDARRDPLDRSYRAVFAIPDLGRVVFSMQLARIAQAMVAVALVLFSLAEFGSPAVAGHRHLRHPAAGHPAQPHRGRTPRPPWSGPAHRGRLHRGHDHDGARRRPGDGGAADRAAAGGHRRHLVDDRSVQPDRPAQPVPDDGAPSTSGSGSTPSTPAAMSWPPSSARHSPRRWSRSWGPAWRSWPSPSRTRSRRSSCWPVREPADTPAGSGPAARRCMAGSALRVGQPVAAGPRLLDLDPQPRGRHLDHRHPHHRARAAGWLGGHGRRRVRHLGGRRGDLGGTVGPHRLPPTGMAAAGPADGLHGSGDAADAARRRSRGHRPRRGRA